MTPIDLCHVLLLISVSIMAIMIVRDNRKIVRLEEELRCRPLPSQTAHETGRAIERELRKRTFKL